MRSSRGAGLRRLLLLLCVGLAWPLAASRPLVAQEVEVQSGVEPREVTVGDRFRSVIRIHTPAGTAVRFPPTLGGGEVLEDVGEVQVLGGEDGEPITAVYTLVAWQTGALPEPVLDVRLVLAGGEEHALRIAAPMPAVRSVLPADTAGVEPRPARGILEEASRFPWYWLALGALLLVLAAALVWWLLRRSTRSGAAPLAGSPRETALEELELARRAGLVEAGEWKPFFSQVSDAVRRYLDAISPRWTDDLTTGELLSRLRRDGVEPEQAERIESVLRRADLVKFARYRPTADEADASWHAARRVVETLERPGAGVPTDPPAYEEDKIPAAAAAGGAR